jgi:hypothetical protein
MEETENLAKYLLMTRGENLNLGSTSIANSMLQLNDKEYDGQLATVRDSITSANDMFNYESVYQAYVSSIRSKLTAISGDDETNGNYDLKLFDKKINLNDSSVFSYVTESGPLKTLLASNLGQLSKTGDFFTSKNAEKVFQAQLSKYDGLKPGKISPTTGAITEGTNPDIFLDKKIDVGKSQNITIATGPDEDDVLTVGQYDIANTVQQNSIKQLRSFNDISRLTSLVSSKNNIGNLWTFMNEMFAINNPSSWRIFANLGGVIFSNVYLTVMKSFMFDKLFENDRIASIDPDFVAKRTEITKKISAWNTAFQKEKDAIDRNAWKNGRLEGSTVAFFSNKYIVDKANNNGEANLSDLLSELYERYDNFFTEHADKIDEMTDVLYETIGSLLGMAGGMLEPSWVKIIQGLYEKVDASANPNPDKSINLKDFVMGLLGIFTLGTNEMLQDPQSTTDNPNSDSNLTTYAYIHDLDLTNEKNMANVKWALGYQNGELVSGSVFDRLYTMFNEKDSSEYKVMNALFLSDDGVMRKVIKAGLDSVKSNSINAIFGQDIILEKDMTADDDAAEYENYPVNWEFSNPEFDASTDTVTYDVTYTGPGDSSINYALHENPIVTKADLANASPYIHTSNGNGVWDILQNKLSDTNKYDVNWFVGYDGTGQAYTETTNTYRISFTNISGSGTQQKWGLSNIEWYHEGTRMYNLFE